MNGWLDTGKVLIRCANLRPRFLESLSPNISQTNTWKRDFLQKVEKYILASLIKFLLLHQLTNKTNFKPRQGYSTFRNHYEFILQISAFFLFFNFRKGRLPYIRPVGRLVGRLTSPLFFQYINKIKALFSPVPLNTKQYQVILTKNHQVPTSTAPH